MKKSLLFLFGMIILGILPILSQEHKEKFFVAKIEFGSNIENLSETKVEAALNLIQRLTNRFELIPNDIRDSIAKIIESEGKLPTVLEIGKRTNATRALFLKINRLANILRVDISTYNFFDSSSIWGKGYAPIHYRLKEKNEPLYDPALISATQRAIADLFRDSLMFWGLSGSFKVKPAPTLVVASIHYIESDSLRKWEIFRKRQVSSFFAVELIFEEARLSNDFVVFDTETRDSVYALHNFFEPENFSAPSPIEIWALYNLEVDFLLTGELFTEANSVKIRLYLCKIDKDGLIIEKQAEEILPEDDLEKFSQTLKLLTSKLLKIGE